MKRKKRIINILVALTLTVLPVCAAEIPTYDMEEIIVSAEAYQSTVNTETLQVKVVNPAKTATIPEILRQATGIDPQRRATAGDSQDGTVKLRGFDARRYTVLINGRPVNMSGVMGGSYFDWTTIPADMVEKIQIIKGAKAAAYGNTLGGVINIITKDRTKSGGDLNILAGENGRYQYSFNYGSGDNKFSWNLYANKLGADAFLRNNDYDAEQYGIGLKYDLGSQDSVKFNIGRTEAKRGFIISNVPGTPGYDPRYPAISSANAETLVGGVTLNPGAYWQKFNTHYDTTWTHKTVNGFFRLTYWDNEEKRREVNYDANGVLNLDRMVIADNSSGWQLTGEEKVNNHVYGYGADYKKYRYGYGWYTVGSGMALYPSQKVDLKGYFVDDTWKLDDRWTANVGLRYDQMSGRPDANPAIRSVDYDGLSPKFNFSFQNDRDTTTHISVNRLWRAPSMAEFYWWSTNYSNPSRIGSFTDLKPEKGWNYELGVEKKLSQRYITKLTGFYQDITDYINFTHQYPYSCYNISDATIWGFEWENTYKLDDKSKLLLNYTNQHTKKEGVVAGDNLGLKGELDYRPEHKITLGYQLDIDAWQLRYTMDYTGRQKANYPYGSTSQVEIGGYVLHNLSVVRNLGSGRTVALTVDNLFDKQYVEQYNYPMPGRLVSVSFNQKL